MREYVLPLVFFGMLKVSLTPFVNADMRMVYNISQYLSILEE